MGVSGMDLLWMDITSVFLCVCVHSHARQGQKKKIFGATFRKEHTPYANKWIISQVGSLWCWEDNIFPHSTFFMSINEGVKKP